MKNPPLCLGFILWTFHICTDWSSVCAACSSPTDLQHVVQSVMCLQHAYSPQPENLSMCYTLQILTTQQNSMLQSILWMVFKGICLHFYMCAVAPSRHSQRMYLWWSILYVPCIYTLSRSLLLCLCNIFQGVINSLVCWFYMRRVWKCTFAYD